MQHPSGPLRPTAGGPEDPKVDEVAISEPRPDDAEEDATETDAAGGDADLLDVVSRLTGNNFLGDPRINTVNYIEKLYAAGTIARSGPIPSELLRQLRTTHVKPEWWGKAQEHLKKQPLVFLYARAHSGKTTTAIRLLDACCSGQVRRLSSRTDLRALPASGDLARQNGHVIKALSLESAALLSRLDIDVLAARLREQESFLAVTIDGPTADYPRLDGYTIRCDPPPDPQCVLAARLDWHLGGAYAARRDQEVNAAEIRDQLVHGLSLDEVEELARGLVPVVHGKRTRAQALQQHSRIAKRKVLELLRDRGHTWQRSLILTLAAIDRIWYQDVLDAAADLHDHLGQVERPHAPGRRPIFEFRREGWDGVIQITPIRQYVGPPGVVPAEWVQFINPSFPRAILHAVWYDYVGARRPLLSWLATLAEHRSRAVRLRAAAAVGYLSTFDFWLLWRERLSPWAGSSTATEREMAAWALAVPAQHEVLKDAVASLLGNWSRSQGRGTRNRRRTAVLAYGGAVGLLDPKQAIENIGAIASGDPTLLGEIQRSVVGLCVSGRTDVVVTGLQSWTIGATRTVFLDLAAWEDEPASPLLLTWVGAEPDWTGALVALWSRVLRPPEPVTVHGWRVDGVWDARALRTLSSWVEVADEVPSLQQPLSAVVLSLDLPGDRLSRRQRLRRWTRERHGVARVAGQMALRVLGLLMRRAAQPRGQSLLPFVDHLRWALAADAKRELRGLRGTLFRMTSKRESSSTAHSLLTSLGQQQ